MKWINSGGGPLLCAERHVAANWMGTKGLSTNAVMGIRTDYDRACATTEYLDVVPCGAGNVLVLGDEPLQSSFVSTKLGELFIARWGHAQVDLEDNAFLSRVLRDAFVISEGPLFQIEEGTLILFDSAPQGDEVDGEGARIEPGEYKITVEKLESKEVFNFLIHRFVNAKN
jgi:hypothetical protein